MRNHRDQAWARAEARFDKVQKAAREGTEAKTEREARAQAVDEKITRLRSLRLAKAATEEAQVKTKSGVTKKRSP